MHPDFLPFLSDSLLYITIDHYHFQYELINGYVRTILHIYITYSNISKNKSELY